jgi:hypothetical protein
MMNLWGWISFLYFAAWYHAPVGMAFSPVPIQSSSSVLLIRSYPMSSSHVSSVRVSTPKKSTTSTQLYFFGQPKDDGSPGDYVCMVRTTYLSATLLADNIQMSCMVFLTLLNAIHLAIFQTECLYL